MPKSNEKNFIIKLSDYQKNHAYFSMSRDTIHNNNGRKY
jgi:hypothetical protein